MATSTNPNKKLKTQSSVPSDDITAKGFEYQHVLASQLTNDKERGSCLSPDIV